MSASSPSAPASPPRGRLLTRKSERRRARLTDLERDVDPSIREERRRALRALLSRPLLTDSDSAERVLVARHREWISLWFAHFPAWAFDFDADACRLVKFPADTRDDSRPCRVPKTKDTPLTRRGYVFLCLVLSILVRDNRQLTLKNIADSLAGIAASNTTFANHSVPLALDHRGTRRDLVHALRVLMDWGVLVVVEAQDESYISSGEGDVLYTVSRPILSRLLATRQPPSLVEADDFESRLREIHRGAATESLRESEDFRNREIRSMLYRRLLDDPVLYDADLSETERDYWKKRRTFILREIENATGLVAEIRAEGTAMVDPLGDVSDYSLPESGTDGHLALLMATMLADRLRDGNNAPVSVSELQAETKRLAHQHSGWRKDSREQGAEIVLTRDTLARLAALSLIRLEKTDTGEVVVHPLPAIGRFGLRKSTSENQVASSQEDLF